MTDISNNPEFDNLIFSIQELETELADLVFDRDRLLYHICPNLQAEYMLKIGKLEYAIFEYQCEILRTKRKIEIIQAFINRKQSYSIVEIEEQLEIEYQEYSRKLLEKQKEIEEARLKKSNRGRLLTDEEATELKKLYTQIVKKLHPDINPNTTEEQHGQFIDAVNAYKNADLTELRIIFLLLDKIFITDNANTMEKLLSKKEELVKEKNFLTSEIFTIKGSFPYCIKDLLQDKNSLQNKIVELSDLLDSLKEQQKNIETRMESMLKSANE